MSNQEKIIKIKKCSLLPIQNGAITAPGLVFDGDKPAVGATLEFDPGNGVTYTGVVAAVVEADGNNLVEFKDGIAPKS